MFFGGVSDKSESNRQEKIDLLCAKINLKLSPACASASVWAGTVFSYLFLLKHVIFPGSLFLAVGPQRLEECLTDPRMVR